MTAIRIRDNRDIRTPELVGRAAAIEQDRADIRLEAEWRERVRANIRRRIQDGRYNPRNI